MTPNKEQDKLSLFDIERTQAEFLRLIAGIAQGTSYKVISPETSAEEISMDTCWKIYRGLRGANITLDFNDGEGEREVRFSDVVEIVDG